MRTTLVIDDQLLGRLREEAARRNTTMSALVEEALRGLFERRQGSKELPPLPVYRSGGANVDVNDREALEEFIERHDRRDERLYGRRD